MAPRGPSITDAGPLGFWWRGRGISPSAAYHVIDAPSGSGARTLPNLGRVGLIDDFLSCWFRLELLRQVPASVVAGIISQRLLPKVAVIEFRCIDLMPVEYSE
jgi:hypothetical protein